VTPSYAQWQLKTGPDLREIGMFDGKERETEYVTVISLVNNLETSSMRFNYPPLNSSLIFQKSVPVSFYIALHNLASVDQPTSFECVLFITLDCHC